MVGGRDVGIGLGDREAVGLGEADGVAVGPAVAMGVADGVRSGTTAAALGEHATTQTARTSRLNSGRVRMGLTSVAART